MWHPGSKECERAKGEVPQFPSRAHHSDLLPPQWHWAPPPKASASSPQLHSGDRAFNRWAFGGRVQPEQPDRDAGPNAEPEGGDESRGVWLSLQRTGPEVPGFHSCATPCAQPWAVALFAGSLWESPSPGWKLQWSGARVSMTRATSSRLPGVSLGLSIQAGMFSAQRVPKSLCLGASPAMHRPPPGCCGEQGKCPGLPRPRGL